MLISLATAGGVGQDGLQLQSDGRVMGKLRQRGPSPGSFLGSPRMTEGAAVGGTGVAGAEWVRGCSVC